MNFWGIHRQIGPRYRQGSASVEIFPLLAAAREGYLRECIAPRERIPILYLNKPFRYRKAGECRASGKGVKSDFAQGYR